MTEVVVTSVALATADADVVVAGGVAGSGAPRPTSDPRPPGTLRLTVRVTEHLKGEAGDTLDVVGAPPSWTEGTPVVLFARYEPVASVCGADPETGRVSRSPELRLTRLVAGDPGSWSLADRAFRVVHDGEALLAGARPEVAEIFRRFGPSYLRRVVLVPEQGRVLRNVIACRTAARRSHGHVRPLRRVVAPLRLLPDRHCPTGSGTRGRRAGTGSSTGC